MKTVTQDNNESVISNTLLSIRHFEHLKKSSIDDRVIKERGYRSIYDPEDLIDLGFKPCQCNVPGILIPIYGVGGDQSSIQYRPDFYTEATSKNDLRRADYAKWMLLEILEAHLPKKNA